MNIILMGPPGSGKGTQAKLLCEHYGLVHVSTGDLLRSAMQADTPEGRSLKEQMGTGNMISDDVVLDLLGQRLRQDDCKTGYLLDGFPRNLDQAFAIKALGFEAENVVNIDVPFDVIVKRMAGRRFHLASGRSYHVTLNPPQQPGLDDATGEPLIQRKDDYLISWRIGSTCTWSKPIRSSITTRSKPSWANWATRRSMDWERSKRSSTASPWAWRYCRNQGCWVATGPEHPKQERRQMRVYLGANALWVISVARWVGRNGRARFDHRFGTIAP